MAVSDDQVRQLLTCVREPERRLAEKEFERAPGWWTALIVAWSTFPHSIDYPHFRRLCHSTFFERRESDEDFCEILAMALSIEPNFVSINTLAAVGADLNDANVRLVLRMCKLQVFPTRTHLKRYMEDRHADQHAQARALQLHARLPGARHEDGWGAH